MGRTLNSRQQYIKRQRDWINRNDICFGDTVKVINRERVSGWDSSFSHIGMGIGTVSTVQRFHKNALGIALSDGYWYPYNALKVIRRAKTRVRITNVIQVSDDYFGRPYKTGVLVSGFRFSWRKIEKAANGDIYALNVKNGYNVKKSWDDRNVFFIGCQTVQKATLHKLLTVKDKLFAGA